MKNQSLTDNQVTTEKARTHNITYPKGGGRVSKTF